MKLLFVDLETYSTTDIKKCGAYKYVEDDNFEILLCGYAYDNEPVQVIDMTKDKLPEQFIADMFDPEVVKIAWNAAFERTCFTKYFGTYTHPSQWFDPMVLSASCGLPLSLAMAGEALGLGEDQAKMRIGKQLITYFCGPCKPTRTNGMRTRNLPEHAPDKWDTFVEYNRRDVEVERTIYKRLIKWKPDRKEQKFWTLDQQINDRGIRVDMDLTTKVMDMCGMYKEGLLQEAVAISGLDNPESTMQVKNWLLEQEGIEAPSLNKKVVVDVVKCLKSEDAKRFMELRSEFSQSSVAKYDAVKRCAGKDEHVHGCFQFYGASTGRFSGRLVQLQNLSHDTIDDLDAARSLAKTGDYEDFKATYPEVQYVAKCLIRTLLIPEKDSRFIVADFSAIEARVVAWIAGETWRLETFRNNGDIYCASASQAFKVPVVKHGENGHLRAKGKIIELACIAEDSLVLTDKGQVPIQDVTTDMKVWDGEEWVSHEGVIYKGEKEVIEYDGLRATADHEVYTSGEQRPVHFGFASSCGAHLIQTGHGRKTVRMGENNISREKMEPKAESLLRTYGMYEVWICSVDVSYEPYEWEIEGLSKLFRTTTGCPVMASEKTYGCETALRESLRSGVSQLWGQGDSVRFFFCCRSGKVTYTEIRNPGQEHGDRQDRYERELFYRQPKICDASSELCEPAEMCIEQMGSAVLAVQQTSSYEIFVSWIFEGTDNRTGEGCGIRQEKKLEGHCRKVKVYDIRNAGRHHRYTVSNKLVHNCGYGGGIGAMKNFGADRMGMTEEEMAELVAKWRDASPQIVKLWKAIETAAVKCVKTKKHQDVVAAQPVSFDMEDGVLFMTLPSGRRIAYWGAEIGNDKWGRSSLTYMTTNMQHKWVRVETFGGKLVENCLAEDTLVLTNVGLVPIQKITDDMKVWDGEEFVTHDGLINQGVRQVIRVGSLLMTPNHKILTTKGWIESSNANGFDWEEVELPNSYTTAREKMWKTNVAVQMRLWERSSFRPKRCNVRKVCNEILRMHETKANKRVEKDSRDDKTSGIRSVAFYGSEMHGTDSSCLEKLRRTWNNGVRKMVTQLRELLGRHGAILRKRTGLRPGEQQSRILERKLPMGYEKDELTKQKVEYNCNHEVWDPYSIGTVRDNRNKRKHAMLQDEERVARRIAVYPSEFQKQVYDIRNCGKRHRFVVYDDGNFRIVSNCIQATARDVLREAMFHLDAAGYDIRGHVHDEIIMTVPNGTGSLEEAISLMCKGAKWTEGLPLNADGYENSISYRKD